MTSSTVTVTEPNLDLRVPGDRLASTVVDTVRERLQRQAGRTDLSAGVAGAEGADGGNRSTMNVEPEISLQDLTPEELVARSRELDGEAAAACLEELYDRFYPKVISWCWRVCGDREKALDVAQEVFLRVHTRLDSFGGRSRFSTWLYTVTRRVAINRAQSERLRRMASIDEDGGLTATLSIDEPSPEEQAAAGEIGERLRAAIDRDLTSTEAQVLYLHFVDGLSLPSITELLELENKSGAKAYVVGGKRKLQKRFGRWFAAQEGGDSRDDE